MVQIATDIVTLPYTGRKSPVPELKEKKFAHYGVKEAVFPFNMFPEVDPVLWNLKCVPPVRSLDCLQTLVMHFFKAEEATKTKLPTSGCVLISVNDRDKAEVVDVARGFYQLGFEIMATGRTCDLIEQAGIPALKVCKLNEGRLNILDKITNDQIQLIVNTPRGKKGTTDDSYIRKAAIKNRIPYITTMAAAKATVEGIRSAKRDGKLPVQSLQEFHASIIDK